MNRLCKTICAIFIASLTAFTCFSTASACCVLVPAPLVTECELGNELYINPDILEEYESAARYIAKTVYGEARGESTTVQAAVIWTILNRVDERETQTNKDIIAIITKKGQFHGYKEEYPVEEEYFDLAIDVISRWLLEKRGVEDVGRVLPKEYTFFAGYRNMRFRDAYDGDFNYWDWSLESPYEED